MRIQKFDSERFSRTYEILCRGAHPWEGVAESPFASTWCVVEPGKTARAHKHQEHEAFFIVSGKGRMRIDEESAEVARGDVVFMEPFSVHELDNLSHEEELIFLDLCWEDMAEATRKNDASLGDSRAPGTRSVLLTATPPTPNGDFHVGHLAGPYLGADIYKRYLQMRGVEVHYLTGVDDHQSYVVTKALKRGSTPREVARSYGDTMEETLRRARIEVDHVARVQSSPYHVELVQKVFQELYAKGALVARDAPTLYCESCARYVFEAHVDGLCPHCGAGSGGNACEACGRPNDCTDLESPRCHHCGTQPVIRQLKRIYFPLAPYEDRLRELYDRIQMNPHMRSLCLKMIADGLPEIAVSHETDWGIPVTVPGFEKQKIYVWFEMGPGYLAAARELLGKPGDDADWKSFWGSPDRQVVQFFGFDNGYFHAVLFPATFFACDGDIRQATAFLTNEFYFYEGSKFSTSRNHAMWARELLDRVPVDAARFYLAYDRPDSEQRNFTLAALEETVRRELTGEWEPWLRELGRKVKTHFGGALPGTGAWTRDHQHFFQDLTRLNGEAARAYEMEAFCPPRAAQTMIELVRAARRFAKAEEHWQGIPQRFEEWRTAVALEALAAKTLARIAGPVMPDFAAQLWRDLGYDGSLFDGTWEESLELVPSGREVGGLDRRYFAAP